MKDLPYFKLVGATVVLTVLCSLVMVGLIDWNGEQASTAAAPIDDLLDVMIVLSAFVFSLVMVMLIYSLVKWRARPGDEGDGAPIHGNTRLEIAWTLIPTIIVLIAGGLSWKTLEDIEARDPDSQVINVTSQQFEWDFQYPEQGGIESKELHVPVGQQIEFKLHALDVIHSFWVPEWRIKKDNVPGITTRAIVTPNKEGEYSVVCTELCGYGHATMRAKVVVHNQADFDAWVAEQQAETAGSSAAGGAS
jgi:cytochrome c oxidase subunit 2